MKADKQTATAMQLDAIGLARPVGFMDFSGAVSVLSEARALRVMNRVRLVNIAASIHGCVGG